MRTLLCGSHVRVVWIVCTCSSSGFVHSCTYACVLFLYACCVVALSSMDCFVDILTLIWIVSSSSGLSYSLPIFTHPGTRHCDSVCRRIIACLFFLFVWALIKHGLIYLPWLSGLVRFSRPHTNSVVVLAMSWAFCSWCVLRPQKKCACSWDCPLV